MQEGRWSVMIKYGIVGMIGEEESRLVQNDCKGICLKT